MNLSAGQIPDEPSVNGSEKQIAAFCECLRFGDILQNPADFCCGEIGINQKPCFFADFFGVALLLQRITIGCGSSALPDNGIINRLSWLLIPDNCCLPLIGNADGCNILRRHTGLIHSLRHHTLNTLPDFHRIMFHPPRIRKNLSKLFLRHADNSASMVK